MTKDNSIFKLIEIEYCDENPQYPEFEVICRVTGIFPSLEKAEQALKDSVDAKNGGRQNPLFGFFIKEYSEKPPDKRSYDWAAKNGRSYLPDGAFLDKTMVSILPDDNGVREEFLGRPPEKIRFAPGDLVETLHITGSYSTRDGRKFEKGSVTLDIVTHVPWTPEKVREFHEEMREHYEKYPRFQKNCNMNKLDASDDYYNTIEPIDNFDIYKSVWAMMVFPVRFPVSDELYNYKCVSKTVPCPPFERAEKEILEYIEPLSEGDLYRYFKRHKKHLETFAKYIDIGKKMDKNRILYILSNIYIEFACPYEKMRDFYAENDIAWWGILGVLGQMSSNKHEYRQNKDNYGEILHNINPEVPIDIASYTIDKEDIYMSVIENIQYLFENILPRCNEEMRASLVISTWWDLIRPYR